VWTSARIYCRAVDHTIAAYCHCPYVGVMQHEENIQPTSIAPVKEDGKGSNNGLVADNELRGELDSETSALAVSGSQPIMNGNSETPLECAANEDEYLEKELDPLEENKPTSDISKQSSKVTGTVKKPISSSVKVKKWCDVVWFISCYVIVIRRPHLLVPHCLTVSGPLPVPPYP